MVLPSTSTNQWPTVLEFLVQRFPHVSAAQWCQRMDAGAVMDEHGIPIRADCSYHSVRRPCRLYYFRTLEVEPKIPFEARVLWRDDHLLVVDKPHFLPVVPSGKYLQETLLVRLKRALDNDALVPIHRIDRDTAGLVLFSLQPATRNLYHGLFRQRAVEKTYEAIAPWNPDMSLSWPLRRESRIVAGAHFMQQIEVAGNPNAITHIRPVEVQGALARYVLQPVTGQRHQLRVHMAALGLPLVGDGIYPTLTPEGSANYARPLQLLARSIAFTDPLSGVNRQFESSQKLRTLTDIHADARS